MKQRGNAGVGRDSAGILREREHGPRHRSEFPECPRSRPAGDPRYQSVCCAELPDAIVPASGGTAPDLDEVGKNASRVALELELIEADVADADITAASRVVGIRRCMHDGVRDSARLPATDV